MCRENTCELYYKDLSKIFFRLQNAIIIGKKKYRDIQYYTEVRYYTED
jgi:nucleosome binding factor SPN SPT16 subunit